MFEGIGGALLGAGSSLLGDWWNTQQQEENREYMKRVQRTTWAREDNAVQRRVADLRAAGLSPTLAAGSAASSSAPVRLEPVQTEAGRTGAKALEAAANALTLRKMQAEIGKTQAEARTANANAAFSEELGKFAKERAWNRKESESWNMVRSGAEYYNELERGVGLKLVNEITSRYGFSKAKAESIIREVDAEMGQYYSEAQKAGGTGFVRTAAEWAKLVDAVFSALGKVR